MDKVAKKPTVVQAFLPIVVMLLLLAIGFGVFGLPPEPLLILSSVFAGVMGLFLGVDWSTMLEHIQEKFKQAVPAVLILIAIGGLIGIWMVSGIIPMFIYYGVQLINPTYLLITSFVITAFITIFTGTSWGSVGTIGVALIGIAKGLDVSLAATAGAIISGAYFGDKLSPLSDTTNLAPIAAGSELYEHIRHMLWTTIPATVLSLIVYFIAGFNVKTTNDLSSPQIQNLLNYLNNNFEWSIFLLIPPLIILVGAVLKYPSLPVIVASIITAGVFSILIQGTSLVTASTSIVEGFNINMIAQRGEEPKNIANLLNQGGMQSIASVTIIAFCAFVFAGILSATRTLEVIIETLLKFVHSTGKLILTTVLSCITMAFVTGNSYLSILLTGEMYKDSFKKYNLASKNLSRTLEDSGTVIVPLIPWSAAGVFMSSTMGVSTIEYVPWAILNYTGFIFAIIYGFTGIGIANIDEESKKY